MGLELTTLSQELHGPLTQPARCHFEIHNNFVFEFVFCKWSPMGQGSMSTSMEPCALDAWQPAPHLPGSLVLLGLPLPWPSSNHHHPFVPGGSLGGRGVRVQSAQSMVSGERRGVGRLHLGWNAVMRSAVAPCPSPTASPGTACVLVQMWSPWGGLRVVGWAACPMAKGITWLDPHTPTPGLGSGSPAAGVRGTL